MKIGKSKRNVYLKENAISFLNFLPEKRYSINGITAIPRKGGDDYFMLFCPREQEISRHMTLNRNETFVDVGANVGFYSIKIAHENKDIGVNVIAVEADPSNYNALCRNIKINKLKNVTPVKMAVSDRKGLVALHEACDSNNRVRSWCYTLFDAFPDNPNHVRTTGKFSEVECDILDNILAGHKNIGLMKIDIEGAEVKALKGSMNILENVRKVLVEIHGDNYNDVFEILSSFGFRVETIREPGGTFILGIR